MSQPMPETLAELGLYDSPESRLYDKAYELALHYALQVGYRGDIEPVALAIALAAHNTLEALNFTHVGQEVLFV